MRWSINQNLKTRIILYPYQFDCNLSWLTLVNSYVIGYSARTSFPAYVGLHCYFGQLMFMSWSNKSKVHSILYLYLWWWPMLVCTCQKFWPPSWKSALTPSLLYDTSLFFNVQFFPLQTLILATTIISFSFLYLHYTL